MKEKKKKSHKDNKKSKRKSERKLKKEKKKRDKKLKKQLKSSDKSPAIKTVTECKPNNSTNQLNEEKTEDIYCGPSIGK